MLDSFTSPIGTTTLSNNEAPPEPQIAVLEASDTYGKFTVEPLKQGYGTTIGNPLRRVLLGSIPGTAVTWVKIDGVLHEYSTIPHVKEEVVELLLNIKGIRIRSLSGRPGKMRLEISGEGQVCAGDIATSADFEIVNPELHLASLQSRDARLSVEFNVEQGEGYRPATQGNGLPVGVLPVDAIFSPVQKVNYTVEPTRVGQVTNYERLVLEIWTDGTVTPLDALKKAADILVQRFYLFTTVGRAGQPQGDRPPTAKVIPPDIYQMPIEKLELSPRTLNCLKRAHITKVGQILEMDKEDLFKIRNFGEKSLSELYSRLRANNLLPPEEAEALENGQRAEPEEQEDE